MLLILFSIRCKFDKREDNNATAFYSLFIETNTGILSACLPTMRPILKTYSVTSLLSRFTKTVTNSFELNSEPAKTALPGPRPGIYSNSTHSSIENGLIEFQCRDLGSHHSEASATYDNSHAALQSPAAIHYQSSKPVLACPPP